MSFLLYCGFIPRKWTNQIQVFWILTNYRVFLRNKKRSKSENSGSTVCYIFAPIFPIWITCYPPMGTINFRKYLRLFRIELIKTIEIRFLQFGKIEAKMLYPITKSALHSAPLTALVEFGSMIGCLTVVAVTDYKKLVLSRPNIQN
jgi:hypothetical protein